MKSFLRTFVFVILATRITSSVLDAIEFNVPFIRAFFLFVLAISLLYFFLRPLLKLLSLPFKGFGYLLIHFVMTLIIVNVMVVLIGSFTLKAVNLNNFNILGFVIPSKNLTVLWSSVYFALLLSLVYDFFDWLTEKK